MLQYLSAHKSYMAFWILVWLTTMTIQVCLAYWIVAEIRKVK